MLTTDVTLDGFVGQGGADPHWADRYYDDELIRYHLRVLTKAGLHALEPDWEIDTLVELKTEGGREELAPIVAQGGPLFCQELTGRGLVDEYRITVHPVVFGEGDRLFAAAERLYLISTRFFRMGSLAHTYVPERAYRDHPPPLPWAQGPGEHHDDPQSEDPAQGPAPG